MNGNLPDVSQWQPTASSGLRDALMTTAVAPPASCPVPPTPLRRPGRDLSRHRLLGVSSVAEAEIRISRTALEL